MLDIKNIRRAVEQIAEEKGIAPERIIEAIESAIAAAYKREYEKKGEIIRAKFDTKTGRLKFWLIKTVVDETTVRMPSSDEEAFSDTEIDREKTQTSTQGKSRTFLSSRQARLDPEEEEGELPRFNTDRHILFTEAKTYKKDVQLGEELEFPLETHEDFGRIAAQTAKQVVLQKLREAERESILSEFRDREGQIVSGTVQRFERGNVFVELGRATGVLFGSEAIPGEHYKAGDRYKFYVLAIQEETRLPGIILSRAHPKFVNKLFELEVPEIADGSVEIRAMAREPGSRTKVAVYSETEGVDPVGACVGQRGTRVMAVSNELGTEKVDVIEWSEDPAQFIANSLSPAKVREVDILDRREAKAFVDEDQLSLAIGRGGQNVRLAAKLTGWRIDVRSIVKPDQIQEEGIAAGAGSTTPDSTEEPQAPTSEPTVNPEDKTS